MKFHILFYNNGPDIWNGFPDITHIKENYGRKSDIFNLIVLKFSEHTSIPRWNGTFCFIVMI